jgi:hypothetical protein
MNKSLCVLICFLVGILVYSLIRSYCSCDVVEGYLKFNNNYLDSPNKCRTGKDKNTDLCNEAATNPNCGGRGDVEVCSKDIYDFSNLGGSCNLASDLNDIKYIKDSKCTDSEKVEYLKWFMHCPGFGDDEPVCSGGKKSVSCTNDIDCNNHGTASGTRPKCTCECETGWGGKNCKKCDVEYHLNEDKTECIKDMYECETSTPIVGGPTIGSCILSESGTLDMSTCNEDCIDGDDYKYCCVGPGSGDTDKYLANYKQICSCNTDGRLCLEGYTGDNCETCDDEYVIKTSPNGQYLGCIKSDDFNNCQHGNCDDEKCPFCSSLDTCLPVSSGITCPSDSDIPNCGDTCTTTDGIFSPDCNGAADGCFYCNNGKCSNTAPSPICTCTDGTGATGTDCPPNGGEVCASCNSGYTLNDKKCVKDKPAQPIPANCPTTTLCYNGFINKESCKCECDGSWLGIQCDECLLNQCNSNQTLDVKNCVCNDKQPSPPPPPPPPPTCPKPSIDTINGKCKTGKLCAEPGEDFNYISPDTLNVKCCGYTPPYTTKGKCPSRGLDF